jgi:hypothetical protein
MRRIKLHFFPLAAPLGRREVLLVVRPQSPPRQGGLRRSRLDPDRNQTTRALVVFLSQALNDASAPENY